MDQITFAPNEAQIWVVAPLTTVVLHDTKMASSEAVEYQTWTDEYAYRCTVLPWPGQSVFAVPSRSACQAYGFAAKMLGDAHPIIDFGAVVLRASSKYVLRDGRSTPSYIKLWESAKGPARMAVNSERLKPAIHEENDEDFSCQLANSKYDTIGCWSPVKANSCSSKVWVDAPALVKFISADNAGAEVARRRGVEVCTMSPYNSWS